MKRILTLLLCLVASPSWAANYWVDGTNGSDANGCNASASALTTTAKATINAGIACLAASDTLSIRTGTYEVTIDSSVQQIPGGTTFANATTVKAHTGETVTIRGIGMNTSASRFIIFDGLVVDKNHTDIDDDAVNVRNGAGFIRFNNVTAKRAGSSSAPSNGNCVQFSADGVGSNEWIGGRVTDCGDDGSARPAPHAFYVSTPNNLIERVEIDNASQFGVHLYSGTPNNNIIRYNYIHDNGSSLYTSGGILDAGTNNQIYRNLVINNVTASYLTGTTTSGGAFFNNTVYGQSSGFGGGYDAITVNAGTSSWIVKNNIVFNNANNAIVNSSTGGTTSNNTTSNPSFVDAANNNFALTASSSAIDAGTTSIGGVVGTLTCNGSSCDIGAHETVTFNACTVESGDANTIRITFNNSVFSPVEAGTTAGWSARVALSARTVTAVVDTVTNRVDLTISGAAVTAGQVVDWSYTTTGTASDSADLGGLDKHQRLNAFTNEGCTNNVGGTTFTFEQKSFGFFRTRGTESAATTVASTNTNINAIKGGRALLRISILCNTAACSTLNSLLYFSRNSAAYAACPDSFGSDNVRFVGTSTITDMPSQGTATTNRLGAVGGGSFVAGAINRSASAIPSVSLAATNWTEMVFIVEFDTDVTVGDTFDFRIRKSDGTVLDTYTQTPRVTIVDYQGLQ